MASVRGTGDYLTVRAPNPWTGTTSPSIYLSDTGNGFTATSALTQTAHEPEEALNLTFPVKASATTLIQNDANFASTLHCRIPGDTDGLMKRRLKKPQLKKLWRLQGPLPTSQSFDGTNITSGSAPDLERIMKCRPPEVTAGTTLGRQSVNHPDQTSFVRKSLQRNPIPTNRITNIATNNYNIPVTDEKNSVRAVFSKYGSYPRRYIVTAKKNQCHPVRSLQKPPTACFLRPMAVDYKARYDYQQELRKNGEHYLTKSQTNLSELGYVASLHTGICRTGFEYNTHPDDWKVSESSFLAQAICGNEDLPKQHSLSHLPPVSFIPPLLAGVPITKRWPDGGRFGNPTRAWISEVDDVIKTPIDTMSELVAKLAVTRLESLHSGLFRLRPCLNLLGRLLDHGVDKRERLHIFFILISFIARIGLAFYALYCGWCVFTFSLEIVHSLFLPFRIVSHLTLWSLEHF